MVALALAGVAAVVEGGRVSRMERNGVVEIADREVVFTPDTVDKGPADKGAGARGAAVVDSAARRDPLVAAPGSTDAQRAAR